MAEFRMPSLGADMEEGVLVEWFVGEGDRVSRGDVVAAVDTDKAIIEIEVFTSGVVEKLLVEPGTTVPVGAPLALIGDGAADDDRVSESEPIPSEAAPARSPDLAEDREPISAGTQRHHASRVLSPVVRRLADRLGVDPASVTGSGPGGRVTRADIEQAVGSRAAGGTWSPAERPTRPRASPRARRRAGELGVDLGHVRGTGPGGAITETDVLAATGPSAAPPVTAEPAPGTTDRGSGDRAGATTEGAGAASSMRRAIARTMSRSNREIPHYHLTHLVDLDALRSWLDTSNAGRAPAQRVLPAAAILRAVALAARDVPELNGFWVDDGFEPGDGVHMALAVSLRGGGLIAPVLRDADRVELDDLMAAMKDLVQRARRGGLRGSEMQGATLTLTNLGDRGVDTVHGIIHPPQVALVGAGRIIERPVVAEGRVVARPTVVLTLAADHRASDGQTGSRLLRMIDARLQEPAEL